MNIIFMGILGLFFLGIGIYTRLGKGKLWYLIEGVSVIIPDGFKYVMIPMGILCISLEVLGSNLVPFDSRVTIGNAILWPQLGIMLILAVWQPSWLLPRWLRILRQTYGTKITNALLKEAAQDWRSWVKRVETDAGLKEWAAKTYQKLTEASRIQSKIEPD